jgi:type IV pilus assembly protein PilB
MSGFFFAYIMEQMERSIGWFRKESMNEDEKRHALAHELGVPFVSLSREDIFSDALIIIPEPLSREHNLLAYRLGEENAVEVALLDMAELDVLNFLRSRYRVLPRLTTRESLNRGLVRYQQHMRDVFGKELEKSDSPTLLDSLLRHALHSRASDMHLQSDTHGLLVRYRINGALRSAMTLPPAAGRNVIGKLRALAGVPLGTLPRQGSFRVDLGSAEELLVRASSVPIVGGEKLVLHIARERARRGYTLEGLGLHGEGLEAVHRMLLKRRGLIRVSGVGKTTLLYTLLDLLNAPEHSLATVERAVSHSLKRVAQTDLVSSGLSAVAAVRGALKTDADVLMIDSVDDRETAAVAEAAAARGVLVLAATDNAELLKDADLFITSAVVRKIGDKQFPERQKLTRTQGEKLEEAANFAKVLATLKEEGRIGKEVAWKDVPFMKPVPSSEHADGYQGTLGVQEVAALGKQVGLTLVEDALFKAAQGQTSIEEVQKLI